MTDWWRERRQNEQLEDLQSEMSYARQETSRLQSQLSKIQGGLQERVNRLSTAFDAFVELSDLRYEMSGFLDAAELRRYTSRVLSAMASSTPLPPPTNPVPQYWLGPATEALIELTGGTEQARDTPLALDQQARGMAIGLDEQALDEQVLDTATGLEEQAPGTAMALDKQAPDTATALNEAAHDTAVTLDGQALGTAMALDERRTATFLALAL